MADSFILFPMEPKEFWKQLRAIVDEVIIQHDEKNPMHSNDNLQPRLLKAKEVCALFKISKPTLYEWMSLGKLPSVKIGSRRFFRSEDVDKLIDGDKTDIVT
jgi:excisionase family DNA binding protein